MRRLSRAQLGHLHSLVLLAIESGAYYGNRAQHDRRLADLRDILACAEAGHLVVSWGPNPGKGRRAAPPQTRE